ncbi:MAG: DHHW family protein [Coriobacteriia bacterium]|nr:DHHW family protein [Coriobacteriia bacterium]
MGNRIRNIAFSAFVAVFTFGVILFAVADHFGVIDMASRSYLEGRNYTQLPEISLERALDKSMQDETESYLADNVPKRTTVLLANAYMQAQSIGLASLPFGFTVCPTYYGSEYAYSSTYDAIFSSPLKVTKESYKSTKKAVNAVNKFIERHPDKSFTYYLADFNSRSMACPLHDLVSEPEDYQFWRENFLQKIDARCTVIDGGYDDSDAYYQDFFHTDHHWQPVGAYKAYQAIVESFGKQPADSGELKTMFTEGMWGSMARSGRSIWSTPDVIRDYLPDLEGISVRINGEEKQLSNLDTGYGEHPFTKKDQLEDVYAGYFHGDSARIEIFNEQGDGGLLIIGDSFTNCMERFFAPNYRYICILDPRRYNGDIDEFIADKDIDDVAFICCFRTMVNNKAVKKLAG